MTTTDQKSRARSPSANLRHLMVAEGFEETVVWQQTGPCISDEPPVEEKPKSASERQAEQTVRDEDEGWKRCYAKAPDDPDARSLVSMVAKAIISPVARRAIRVAVEHPQTVFVGEKVRALRGVRSWIVRWLIGAVDSNANA